MRWPGGGVGPRRPALARQGQRAETGSPLTASTAKASKQSFFEKKDQKTFVGSVPTTKNLPRTRHLCSCYVPNGSTTHT